MLLRAVLIFSQDNDGLSDPTTATSTWFTIKVPVSQKTFSIQFYWTDTTMQAHGPTRDGEALNARLLSGLKEWGRPKKFKLPDLRHMGHHSEGPRNAKMFSITLCLHLVANGADVRVHWQVARPNASLRNAQGAIIKGNAEFSKTDGSLTLVDPAYNPMPRTNATMMIEEE